MDMEMKGPTMPNEIQPKKMADERLRIYRENMIEVLAGDSVDAKDVSALNLLAHIAYQSAVIRELEEMVSKLEAQRIQSMSDAQKLGEKLAAEGCLAIAKAEYEGRGTTLGQSMAASSIAYAIEQEFGLEAK